MNCMMTCCATPTVWIAYLLGAQGHVHKDLQYIPDKIQREQHSGAYIPSTTHKSTTTAAGICRADPASKVDKSCTEVAAHIHETNISALCCLLQPVADNRLKQLTQRINIHILEHAHTGNQLKQAPTTRVRSAGTHDSHAAQTCLFGLFYTSKH